MDDNGYVGESRPSAQTDDKPGRAAGRLPWWLILIDVLLVLVIAGMVLYLMLGLDRHLHGGAQPSPARVTVTDGS